MSTWTRIEDGHPRWEIKNPNRDGRNYQVTDGAIRTFGRQHMTELMISLPPLPEDAWTPPVRKDVTIMTNHETDQGKAMDEPVCPVSVPVRTPRT